MPLHVPSGWVVLAVAPAQLSILRGRWDVLAIAAADRPALGGWAGRDRHGGLPAIIELWDVGWDHVAIWPFGPVVIQETKPDTENQTVFSPVKR